MIHARLKSVGWSPERELWNELVSVTREFRWKKVGLELSSSHRIPKHDTGVYLICARPPSVAVEAINAYTVLYAGQVKSRNRGLHARFLEHIRRPSAKLRQYLHCYYPAVDFWFTIVNEPTEIDLLETLLIETFNPPCNTIGAPGSLTLLARFGTPTHIRANRAHYPS